MKGGITKRLDDTLAALDKKELKKALYLTEGNPKLERQHQWIKEAAQTCLANKGNKEACQAAISEARDRVHGTASLPIDDTSLEGLEDYLTEQKEPTTNENVELVFPVKVASPPVAPGGFLAKAEKTDDQVFEECEECHVAVAAARFADVCAGNPEEAGSCELIGRSLEDESTEPADWIKAMTQTAEGARGKAKEEMVGAIAELTEYLQKRNSPFLKELDKE